MPPKKKPKEVFTRSKTKTRNVPELTPAAPQNDPKTVEPTSNGDISLDEKGSTENMSFDSNGPVEKLPTPKKGIEKGPENNLAIIAEQQNVPNTKQALLEQQSHILAPLAPAIPVGPEKVPDIQIKEENISDEEGTDIIENKVSENLNHQTERMHDLIEELQMLNQSQWSNCKTLKDGIDKLQFLKERANRIKNQSMDLPEFLERRPLSDMPEYDYIKRLTQAWQEVKKHVTEAKDIVHTLPISQIPKTKPGKTPSNVGSSTSSVVSELRMKNAIKGKELDKRAQDLAARSASADYKMRVMYGSKKGRAMNELLDQTVPPFEKQMPKTVIGITNESEEGSRDGDLKTKDVASKNKTSASIENNKDDALFKNKETYSKTCLVIAVYFINCNLIFQHG